MTYAHQNNQTQEGGGVTRPAFMDGVCLGLIHPAVLSAEAYPVVREPQGSRAKHRPTRLHEASEGRGLGANQAGTTYLAPASTMRERARLNGKSNASEPVSKLGYAEQPKVRFVAGLGVVIPLSNGNTQTTKPLRGKQGSNPFLSFIAKPGKPVNLWGNPEGRPQGILIGGRAEECGKSEWMPVMGVIGAWLAWNPATLPQRETVLTSTRSVITREPEEPSERRESK